MKKILSLACAFVLTMTVLAGCSSSPNSSAQESSNSKESSLTSDVSDTGSETAGTGTRTVSTIKGDIVVPESPQRVVVNWYVGDAISAGLNVVGYYCWAQETMPYYDTLMASTSIENWEPEDVMQLEPDLIITYSEDDFDKFSKVAPVLVIPEQDITSLERVKIIGEATGHTEQANAAVKTFEDKLAAAKESLNVDSFNGKTFSIMEDWGASGEWSGIGYETGSRGGTLLYKYLEFQWPEKLTQLIEESGQGRGTLSYEVAHEYFGDYIIWFRQEGKESDYAKTDIWQSIPAVAENRLIEIPGEYQGLFYYDDATSLSAQLDFMLEKLLPLAK
ncbi:ABC transporter substrate-binding protein [Scatolibacter rhodanostii]|uniref:ABC transporter substrate-binding protein n=1 Tax=Scatolibacter rhodanostii TaxID=2014781 RepID=UPI000C070FCB|nr:ABC transporter substrate-binding protein [Scatolibacter rhodanostii]